MLVRVDLVGQLVRRLLCLVVMPLFLQKLMTVSLSICMATTLLGGPVPYTGHR